jgi:hypothetical protein
MDEQLISGFLIAVGNFAKEAVGSVLKKIEMQTGEQLFVYFDETLKLSVAAITSAADYPKLIPEILKKILTQYSEMFKGKIHDVTIVEEGPKFDPVVSKLLEDSTAKRDKKRFILGLLLGSLLLGVLFYLFTPHFIQLITDFYNSIRGPITDPLDTIYIFGGFSFNLEFTLILIFMPSSFLAGYIAGSRSKGKWIGLALFFFTIPTSVFIIIFVSPVGLLYIIMVIIYVPLVLLTSIALGYLGGLLRDQRRLYPVPSDQQVKALGKS